MTFWKKLIYFYYIYGLGLHSVRSIKENYFIIIMHLDRVLSSFERMIFRRLFVCLSLCLSVGTYVRGECGESAETAGVVAPRGRPSSQRNSRMAQHAELDLQAPSPVLPQKGLLQEEPAKIGAALNITSWFHWNNCIILKAMQWSSTGDFRLFDATNPTICCKTFYFILFYFTP